MSLYYQHLTYLEIKAAAERDALILIPVGQVEEHGPHLPVETDCIIATSAARAGPRRSGVKSRCSSFPPCGPPTRCNKWHVGPG